MPFLRLCAVPRVLKNQSRKDDRVRASEACSLGQAWRWRIFNFRLENIAGFSFSVYQPNVVYVEKMRCCLCDEKLNKEGIFPIFVIMHIFENIEKPELERPRIHICQGGLLGHAWRQRIFNFRRGYLKKLILPQPSNAY